MQWSELVKRETVDSTYERIQLLLSQYEEFKQSGFIGDCELRSIAEDYAQSVKSTHTVFFMQDIANEIAHYLARQFLQIRKEAIDIARLA